jgi:hypothetical protein
MNIKPLLNSLSIVTNTYLTSIKPSLILSLIQVPFWFALLSNFCQTQHLIRKSYGIGGGDCYTDCFRPCLCMFIPCVNCVYFYEELASLRAEISTRGRAFNYTYCRPVLPHTTYNAATGVREN